MDEKPGKQTPPSDPRALPDQPEEKVTKRSVPRTGNDGAEPLPPTPRDK